MNLSWMMLSCSAAAVAGNPDDHGVTPLPEVDRVGTMTVEHALERRRSVRAYAAGSLSLHEVGQLAWAAQGVTDRESGYRAAPSAGATFPIEIDVLVHAVESLQDGIYRYLPDTHALRRRSVGDHRQAAYGATFDQSMVRDAPVVVVISAIAARTEERYGDRAGRFVDIEVGHVAQNVYLQAEALGLGTVAIGAFEEEAMAAALELGDGERPLYLLPVGRVG